jgi:hypothetical protein
MASALQKAGSLYRNFYLRRVFFFGMALFMTYQYLDQFAYFGPDGLVPKQAKVVDVWSPPTVRYALRKFESTLEVRDGNEVYYIKVRTGRPLVKDSHIDVLWSPEVLFQVKFPDPILYWDWFDWAFIPLWLGLLVANPVLAVRRLWNPNLKETK